MEYERDVTNEDLKYRIEEEGIGYTLESYYHFETMQDDKTRELFKAALDSINKLKEYLKIK